MRIAAAIEGENFYDATPQSNNFMAGKKKSILII